MWAAVASSKHPALEDAIVCDRSTSSEDEGNPNLHHDLDTSDPVSDLISLIMHLLQRVCVLVNPNPQPTRREILASLALI